MHQAHQRFSPSTWPWAIGLWCSLAAAQAAGPGDCPPRADDQVWMVSCRHLSADCAATEPALRYWRRDDGGCWQPAAAAEFVATANPDAVTCIWVHGNRIADGDAGWIGSTVYARLSAVAGRPPLRFVVWSWPAERTGGGPVADARTKYDRTDAVGYYLAWFVDRQAGQARTSLVGYSLGSRAIAAALELLAGGSVDGQSLAPRHGQPRSLRAVLVAAAIECDALWPAHRYGQAIGQTERCLFVNNSCDRALARFDRLECRRSGPDAVGHVGLAAGRLGGERAQIEQFDAAGDVGKRHDWQLYFGGGATLSRIRRAALYLP